MPRQMDTTAPAVKSPNAANIDQTYASRPKPIGCRLSGSRSDRRSATSKKISLPASAQECAASASIDADAVIAAAIDLAIAISRLARNAISTVSKLWLTFAGCRSLSAVTNSPATLRPYRGPAGPTHLASWLPGFTQGFDRLALHP